LEPHLAFSKTVAKLSAPSGGCEARRWRPCPLGTATGGDGKAVKIRRGRAAVKDVNGSRAGHCRERDGKASPIEVDGGRRDSLY